MKRRLQLSNRAVKGLRAFDRKAPAFRLDLIFEPRRSIAAESEPGLEHQRTPQTEHPAS